MPNPNPIVPHEAGKKTRFRPGYDPRRSSPKLSTKFIADRLEKLCEDGRKANDDILDHLIEVATKWEVIVVGHGDEPISVASARDSVKAAELLWSYALGRPTTGGTVAVPAGIDPRSSPLAIAMEVYRSRLMSGEMTDSELSEMVRVLLAAEKDKALLFLKALGPKLAAMQAEKVQELQRQFEADPATFLGLHAQPVDEAPGEPTPAPTPSPAASPEPTPPPDPFEAPDDDQG